MCSLRRTAYDVQNSAFLRATLCLLSGKQNAKAAQAAAVRCAASGGYGIAFTDAQISSNARKAIAAKPSGFIGEGANKKTGKYLHWV